MDTYKLKKDLIILLLTLSIYSTYKSITKYEPNYEVLDEKEDAYAKYEDGLVYIGNEDYIECLIGNVNEGDVLVIDKRLSDDPDMQVVSSYRITDQDDIKDILGCLLEYESEYPTCWNRTMDSMVTEWEVHNFLYRLLFQRYRTDDVDLNNEDEKVFNNIVLRRLFLTK